MGFRLLVSLLLAAACLTAQTAPGRWKVKFFHDRDNSTFVICDLKFASDRRGVAVGILREKDQERPAALVTADGGESWQFEPLRESPVRLFFLNETVGWLATDRGVWQTAEAGRGWTRLSSLRGVLDILFLDARRGFAAGAPKAVWQTGDGGRQWRKVPEAALPAAGERFTSYHSISFANGQTGLIAGSAVPPRRHEPAFPEWMDPEEAPARRRQWPSLTILLETRDGGAHWTHTQASVFGQVSRLRLTPDGDGLALVEYRQKFDWPSEVQRLDLRSGRSSTVFRRKDRLVTDLLLLPGRTGYLAATEPPGSIPQVPVPGKLKILRSSGLVEWTEMAVDYRAVARRPVLASTPAGSLWVATDTGMILKWEPQ